MDRHPALPPTAPARPKFRFDLDEVLARVEVAVAALPPSLHGALYDAGFRSIFQHVAITVLSSRAPEAAVKIAAERLFRWAPTPERLNRLKPAQVAALIEAVPLAEAKAERLKEIARVAMEKYDGELPGRERILRALPGVGITCANLVLALCCEQDRLAVGAHVARVTKRWGLVTATSTSGIASQLSEKIPRELWRHLGDWLTVFGAHVCTKENPRCASCPVVMYCRQVGVD